MRMRIRILQLRIKLIRRIVFDSCIIFYRLKLFVTSKCTVLLRASYELRCRNSPCLVDACLPCPPSVAGPAEAVTAALLPAAAASAAVAVVASASAVVASAAAVVDAVAAAVVVAVAAAAVAAAEVWL
jgi:hypothetical protein